MLIENESWERPESGTGQLYWGRVWEELVDRSNHRIPK
jgi:hypothetical protein